MSKIYEIFSRIRRGAPTPQSLPLPGSTQVANSAGGFTWAVDDWRRLDRFLILGSEGGAYYIQERALTLENAATAARCLQADGQRVVRRVVEISESGRAPKNDPALFVLAQAAASGDQAVRRAAFEALPRVARIGTHLFHFMAYARQFRGWGRGLRSAVAAWYQQQPVEDLVYQVIKYRQRDGWSHRDALRVAHPVARTAQENAIYHWIAQGWPSIGDEPHPDPVLRRIWAFERMQRAESAAEAARLVSEYDLPWEAVPSQHLASPAVWEALLPRLPLTATLRNLGRLTANGVLESKEQAKSVAARLSDERLLKAARIHPLGVLLALTTYAQGRGEKGSLTWGPVRQIVDALDSAFYLSFGNVEPSGKRLMLALDVSGSMGGSNIAGTALTARSASAAMSLVTANVEPDYLTTIFSSAGTDFYNSGKVAYGGKTGISRFPISPRQRLDDVVRSVSNLPFGGTDCALPMLYAMQQKLEIDAFIIYTDSETWAGAVHPVKALARYRQQTGIPAKLVVVGMTSNGFTIADPDDAGMLDVVGFDAAAPQLITQFIQGV